MFSVVGVDVGYVGALALFIGVIELLKRTYSMNAQIIIVVCVRGRRRRRHCNKSALEKHTLFISYTNSHIRSEPERERGWSDRKKKNMRSITGYACVLFLSRIYFDTFSVKTQIDTTKLER